jgi:hypothetical protein
MALSIMFHQLHFLQFKRFYLSYVCRLLRTEFPRLPSYHHCVELLPRCAAPLAALFMLVKGKMRQHFYRRYHLAGCLQ